MRDVEDGLRGLVARSPLARAAAFPARAAMVARHQGTMITESVRWLTWSREHTNFTYDLTERNLAHLAWWVSAIASAPVAEIREYLLEMDDPDLRRHIERATMQSPRRGLADREVRFGRRAGWYALVRCVQPEHVVETGTDKGLGSCLLAAALLRNGHGRLTTIDINSESGYLIGCPYSDVIDRVVGDSLVLLPALQSIDMFLHDSLHTYAHEMAEYQAAPLTPRALVLSDNAHATDALAEWSELAGRRFLFFDERPHRHWYPGAGIGASWLDE